MVSRRRVVQSITGLCFSTVLSVPALAQQVTPTKLILMGTKGGPSVRDINQVPTSNALIIGKDTYLIDAGYRITMRLVEKKISLNSVRAIFITHHHSDLSLEVGPYIFTDWTSGRDRSVDIYGPDILQRAGIFEYKRGKMHILDRQAQEDASCECYGKMQKNYERILGRSP